MNIGYRVVEFKDTSVCQLVGGDIRRFLSRMTYVMRSSVSVLKAGAHVMLKTVLPADSAPSSYTIRKGTI